MPGVAQVTIVREGFEAAKPSQRRAGLKSSFRFIALRHHRNYKMLKFRRSALRRYGLKPRRGNPGSGRRFKGSYAEAKVQKRRLFAFSDEPLPIGENKPFVWSGRTRASARASRGVQAAATSSGRGHGTAIIRARQLNRAGTRGRINQLEEFQRIAEVERREQEQEGARYYDRRLSRIRARTTTTIRG